MMIDNYAWATNGLTTVSGKTLPGEEALMTLTLTVEVDIQMTSALVIYGDMEIYEYFDIDANTTIADDRPVSHTSYLVNYGNDGNNNFVVITGFTSLIPIGAVVTISNLRVKLSPYLTSFSTYPLYYKGYYDYTSFRTSSLSTEIMMQANDSTLPSFTTDYHAV